MSILVVVRSWNDIFDLLKFWCQSHRGAGLQVSRSMLASCCSLGCPMGALLGRLGGLFGRLEAIRGRRGVLLGCFGGVFGTIFDRLRNFEKSKSANLCLMNLNIARKQAIISRKMLECEAVRRDNNQSAATGFWAGVLKGARENLACN
mgnify:CR=1 FL=1